jgi:ribosome-binding factor A
VAPRWCATAAGEPGFVRRSFPAVGRLVHPSSVSNVRNSLSAVSNRTIRINELVQREMSDYLHTHHQSETVAVTITSVEIDDDLRTGRIFVGVIGMPEFAEDRMRWLKKHSEEIRRELGRRVVLKWNPKWVYVLDDSGERGARIQRVLNEIEAREGTRKNPTDGTSGSTV